MGSDVNKIGCSRV